VDNLIKLIRKSSGLPPD